MLRRLIAALRRDRPIDPARLTWLEDTQRLQGLEKNPKARWY